MENPDLQGVFGILPTPFTDDDEIDEAGLEHLVRHAADSGLHAVIALGSNGEFPYLTWEEKVRVTRVVARAAKGRIPVVGGASSMSTREAVELARVAKDAGCAAVMAALISYFAVDFESVKEHFRKLAEVGVPIIFYYFPETSGVVLGPDEIEEIAAIPGVHGAKITVFNKPFLKRVIKLTRAHLLAVFAGTSFMLRDSLKSGGVGIICPIPLIAPTLCMDLYKAMQDGELERGQDLQDKLLAAVPLFAGIDMPSILAVPYYKAMISKPYTGVSDRMPSGVAVVKEALRLQGHPISSRVRGPNPQLTPEQKDSIKSKMRELGWI